MERLEAIVSGRVQVVMYRDFTCRMAKKLGLVGEVTNLKNGTVRVVAEGAHESLVQLEKKLHNGSFLARVEAVESHFIEANGAYTTFTITYV